MYKPKNLLLLLSLFIFTAGSLFAQSSATAPINISIKKALSITPVSGAINFGEILYGTTNGATLTPDLGAKFLIDGSEIRKVTVTYAASTALTDQFTNTLTFTPNVVETGSDASYNIPNPLSSGTPTDLINNGGNGMLYVWVGGSVDVTTSTPEGEYAGTFTMSVAYN